MTSPVRWVLLVAALLVASGCGDDPALGEEPVPTRQANSCVAVPAPKCDELVTDAMSEFGIGRVRGVHITCSRLPCTVRTGETTIDVELADGRHVTFGSAWDTDGDPERPPVPDLGLQPTCVGVDHDHCVAQVAEAANTSSEEIVAIDVRCVRTCTPDHGQGETVITFPLGRTRTVSWAYGPSG